MRLRYFDIKNFKGIEHVRLEFDAHPRTSIYTMVGLNESGKTTILQALDYFRPRSDGERLDPLQIPGYGTRQNPHELIPKSKQSNFNGQITFEVGYELSQNDQAKIKEYLRKELRFELTSKIEDFHITQVYTFTDSKLKSKHAAHHMVHRVLGKAAIT